MYTEDMCFIIYDTSFTIIVYLYNIIHRPMYLYHIIYHIQTKQEPCNTFDFCPPCKRECDVTSGVFPSCTGCKDFLQCHKGAGQVYTCALGYEWDAFVKKCVNRPSATCSLKTPVTSCSGE